MATDKSEADKSKDLVRASCIWRRYELDNRKTPGPPNCKGKAIARERESAAYKVFLVAVDAYLAIPPAPP